MISPKAIFISVVSGFVLFFLTGIIAGVSFGVVVLRSLIFAIVFGVVVFGVGWVSHRFLSMGEEHIGETQAVPRTGTTIDISIGDEPLPEDENGPDFYVDSEVPVASASETVLKEDDASKTVMSSAEKDGDSLADKNQISEPKDNQPTFKPVALGTSVASNDTGISSESLDVLPDISDFSIGGTESHGEVLENTDFALEGSSEGSFSSSKKSTGGKMDTETIAKAIKTALAKDS